MGEEGKNANSNKNDDNNNDENENSSAISIKNNQENQPDVKWNKRINRVNEVQEEGKETGMIARMRKAIKEGKSTMVAKITKTVEEGKSTIVQTNKHKKERKKNRREAKKSF